jgi:choice-of-anchor C domain-containing protein
LNIAGGIVHLGGSTLTNLGTVAWISGRIDGSGTAYVYNNALWLDETDNQIDNFDGGANFTFINNGIFLKQGTYGTATFYNAMLVNNGLVDVETGTLSLQGGGVLGGTYNTAQSAGFYLASGTFTASVPPVFQGPGTSQFIGGTLNLLADEIPNLPLVGGTVALGTGFQNSGAITNLTLSGANLNGSNTVSGTLNWIAGQLYGWLNVSSNGLLTVTGGSDKNVPNVTLVNYGTVLWTGGRIRGNSDTIITNNGLWQVQCDYEFNNDYCCTPQFVNTGTFTKTVTFGATTFRGFAVLNSGTFDIETGAINFNNSATYAQTGANLEFGASAQNLVGQLNLPGSVNLDGTLQINLLNNYAPNAGDTLTPLTYSSEAGAFANLALPPFTNGQSWSVAYGSTSLSLQATALPPGVTPLQISGSVTDTNGHPVAGVMVYATMTGATNLIQNGSFEQPNIGGTAYVAYPLGSTNISGWTVVGPANISVYIISRSYVQAPGADGNQFFDPTSSPGGGGIAQTFPTTPGASYVLSFAHGTYSHHGYNVVLVVTIGTNYFTYGETSGGYYNLDWRPVAIPFTASSNLTTLTFSSMPYSADDAFVDNVQVAPPGYGTVLEGETDSGGN